MVSKFLKKHLPLPILRLIYSYRYDKETFLLKKSDKVFSEIYNSGYWGNSESYSGGGSSLESTTIIRKELPDLVDRLSIKSLLDVPCGDYNWMKITHLNCHYIGGDIVPEIIERNKSLYSSNKVEFKQIDITKDTIPEVDLIFCRDCLQHLSNDSVMKALRNFKNSQSKYLLVTSYFKTWRNHDIYDGDYRPLNLSKPPFSFTKAILKIEEHPRENEPDKTMFLYELNKIKLT